MHINSKLRYVIDLYGKEIGIPWLYDLYKKNVLKVESAKDIIWDNKVQIIESFKYWLTQVQTWEIDKHTAKLNMLDTFIKTNNEK